MYYIIYPLFYGLSLLPWRVMYLLSDGIYVLVYYIFGYRKKVVMSNLTIAFPEKTEQQKVRIAKNFYRNFIDTFIETIKLISISPKEFDKRCVVDSSMVNELHKTGQSIQFHTGHFFNWEFVNLGIAKNFKGRFIGVYMPMTNKAINKLMLQMRGQFNTILVSAHEFRTSFHTYNKEPYSLGLAADQKPSNPLKAYWLPFFGKMTPFFTGPEKGAVRMNTAVVMTNFYKVKRGYYKIDFSLLTTTPKELPKGEITKKLIEYIEAAVKERPSNYLWSHKRFKFTYDEATHGHLKI